MSLLQEFKTFAMRGNVIDLAVAVVMGTAFGKIISALVDGIIMPLISLLLGVIDVTEKTVTIHHAVIKWGLFLQAILDFSIIASLPATYERSAKRDEVQNRIQWAQGGFIGKVGDKVTETVVLVC